MLPFLKDRHEGGMSGPIESIKMKTDDEEPEFGMLDAIVEDVMEAIAKKDKKLLKEAFQALVEHIQEHDEIQDEEEMK